MKPHPLLYSFESERLHDLIAQEALIPTSVMNAFMKIPTFLSEVRSKLTKVIQTPMQQLSNDRVSKFRAMSEVPYQRVYTTVVEQPPGLNSDLVTYSTALLEAIEACTKGVDTQIRPLTQWLANAVVDPKVFGSASAAHIKDYKRQNLTTSLNNIEKCYRRGGVEHSRRPYSDLFKASGDWSAVVDNVLKMERFFTETYHQNTVQAADRLNSLLDQILRMMEQNEIQKVNGAFTKALADYVHECGRVIETYALLRYRLLELTSVMDAIREKIARIR